MHYLMCMYLDAVEDWWPVAHFPTPSHYLPIGYKIISHLVCKWALQSMTFQKQECKCLVPNQSLCKLMKEQFGFVCRSFGLVCLGLFVCQSNSVYQCGAERRKNSELHANQPICFLKIISSHNTAAAVWACRAFCATKHSFCFRQGARNAQLYPRTSVL